MSERGPDDDAPAPAKVGREGLCPHCRHVKRVVSERGSVFLRCTLAARDPRLPRYPPQPRPFCHAWER